MILAHRRMIFRHILPSHSGPEVVMSATNLVGKPSNFVSSEHKVSADDCKTHLDIPKRWFTIVLRFYHHLQAPKSRTVQDFLECKQCWSLTGGEGCQAKGLTLPHFIHHLQVTFETAVQFVRQTSKYGTSSTDGSVVSHPIHQLQHSSPRIWINFSNIIFKYRLGPGSQSSAEVRKKERFI